MLIPLRELAPAVRHPLSRRTVAELLEDAPDRSQVVRIRDETRDEGQVRGIRAKDMPSDQYFDSRVGRIAYA